MGSMCPMSWMKEPRRSGAKGMKDAPARGQAILPILDGMSSEMTGDTGSMEQ
jgi:hypothetical protein